MKAYISEPLVRTLTPVSSKTSQNDRRLDSILSFKGDSRAEAQRLIIHIATIT